MKNFLRIIISLIVCAGMSCSSFGADAIPPSSSVEHNIANFTNDTVENLQYSTYKLGGKHFDAYKGIYVLDCSSYVDHILKNASPVAYHKLVNVTGSLEPTSRDYYEFFKSLPKNNPERLWNQVEKVKALHAGDIVVFRFQHSAAPGHVMVVMNKPIQKVNTFSVRVADSASVRHSEDTRGISHSGVGIGTMLLKTNPKTGKPYAYAWQKGSHWEKHVNIAMARPLDHVTSVTQVTTTQTRKQNHIVTHTKVIHTTTVTHHHLAKASAKHHLHKIRLAARAKKTTHAFS